MAFLLIPSAPPCALAVPPPRDHGGARVGRRHAARRHCARFRPGGGRRPHGANRIAQDAGDPCCGHAHTRRAHP
eukprot:1385289-Pleurochrysis_carterae.AAC.1